MGIVGLFQGERGGTLSGLYQDRDQKPVAGIERIGEQGVDVSGQRAKEAEDQDRSGKRYSNKVRKRPDDGDLLEGGCHYGRGR
jgi:hypothetical protein